MQKLHNNVIIEMTEDIGNENDVDVKLHYYRQQRKNIPVQDGIKARKRIKRLNSKRILNTNALEGHDKTLKQLARSNFRLAQSINCLAAALNKIAHKL